MTKEIIKDMLKFAIEKEYYEKAAILRDFLNQMKDE
jgi:protein-arginine kinase activator protein McsA